MKLWERFVSRPINWGGRSACDFTTGASVRHATQNTCNWSGIEAYGEFYTDAMADFQIPTNPSGSNATVSQWVGVNDNSSGSTEFPLVQAGVDTQGDAQSLPAVWIEAYPGPPHYVSEFKGHVAHGSVLFVHSNLGSTGVANFHIVDYGSGISHWYTLSTGGALDGHAEFIAERPLLTNSSPAYFPVLTNFGKVEYTGSQVAYSGAWHALGTVPDTTVKMYDDNGSLLAEPGSVYSEDFFDYYASGGDIDHLGAKCP